MKINRITIGLLVLSTVLIIFLNLSNKDVRRLLNIVSDYEAHILILDETIRLYEKREIFLSESTERLFEENQRLDSIIDSFRIEPVVSCTIEKDDITNEKTIVHTVISDRIRPDVDRMLTEAYDAVYKGTD